MKRASADVGLIFVAYNLRRMMNILGPDKLKEFLKALSSVFCSIMAYFKAICRSRFYVPGKLQKIKIRLISNRLPNFNPIFSPKIAFGGGC
jgi:hypothetical protein